MAPGPEERLIVDVTDLGAITEACAGMGAIVHLAGIANEATWTDILRVNIDGTHAVLEAARQAGVHRVILASSNHTAGFHERPMTGDLPAEWMSSPCESVRALRRSVTSGTWRRGCPLMTVAVSWTPP